MRLQPASGVRRRLRTLPLAAERQTLIWLDSVKRADRSLPHGCELLSQHALSVLFVLQIRLVGGTAF